MARRTIDKQKSTKTKKKETKEVKKRGRKTSFATKVRLKLIGKTDIRIFLNGVIPDCPTFWCDRNGCFINLMPCFDRKFIRKDRKCTKCKEGIFKLESLLGDKAKDF